MALSKPKKFTEKLNKVDITHVETTIHPEEIMLQCFYNYDKAISIDLIHHMLGGDHSDYKIIPVQESFECYNHCRQEMLNYVQETKMDILFFEDRKNATSNVIIVALKQEKKKGAWEHIILLAVIHITVMVTPKVTFCRYFKLIGKLI